MPTAQRRSFQLIVLLTSLWVGQETFGQTYSWQWGKGLSTNSDEEVTGVATQSTTGDIYSCGYTEGTGLISGSAGTVSGVQDAFLFKYNASGIQQWAFTPSGSGESRATGVALDDAGNVYVTGWFKGTIDLNGLSAAGSGTVISSGNADWFIASYTPAGALRWRTKLGGSGNDLPSGIALSPTMVAVFGTVNGRITTSFGTIPVALPNNKDNLALVGYNLTGSGQWLISGGSGDDEIAHSMTMAGSKAHVAYDTQHPTCNWYGTSGTLLTTHVASSDRQLRVSTFANTGVHLWTTSVDEAGNNMLGSAGLAAGCDALYITGITASPTTFPGVGSISTGTSDMFFLGRIDPVTGQYEWVTTGTSTGSSNTTGGAAVTVGRAGVVHVIGNYKSTVTIGGTTLTSPNTKMQPFIATFRSTGSFVRSEKFVSTHDARGSCVTADATGNFVIGGSFDTDLSCGSLTLAGPGNANGFMYKGLLPSVGGADLSYWAPPAPLCSNAAPFNLTSLLTPTVSGSAAAVANSNNVVGPGGAVGAVQGSYAQFNTASGYVTLDLGMTVPTGTYISVLWRSTGGSATANITSGTTASPPANSNGSITTTSTAAVYSELQLTSPARYIRITRPASGSATFEVDGIYYSYGNDLGGTWSGTGVSGSTFDPAGLAGNINVTYTVGSGSCASATTNAIQVIAAPNAGTNGTLSTCAASPASNLFLQLGGSPQAGGIWSGPSPVIGGMFNPATMAPGNYVYTVVPSGICLGNATATVVVTVGAAPGGGTFTGGGTVCPAPASGTLSISGHSGTITGWAYSIDGGTNWNLINNTANNITWTNLGVPTMYRVALSQAGCGNGSSPIVSLTPQDLSIPVLICPSVEPVATAYASGTCTMQVPSFVGQYTASDNCTAVPTVAQTPVAGSFIPFDEDVQVTIRAVDAAGNVSSTCVATIIGVDTLAATFICPANSVVFAPANVCSATHTASPIAYSDNCWGNGTAEKTYLQAGVVSITPLSTFDPTGWTEISASLTATLPIGDHTIAFVHENGVEDVALCSYTVSVVDNVGPTITCPTDISQNTDFGSCGAVVTYSTPVGTDNCGGATTARTAGPASGSTFPVGSTTVTHTVTDAVGLSASCSFSVTVIDATAPTIACPSDIALNAAAGACGAVVTYNTPAFSDNCPGATITRTSGLASGSLFPVGTTVITHVVTPVSGPSATCTFWVTVFDNEVPALTGCNNVFANTASGCSAIVNFPTASATDNCTTCPTAAPAGTALLGTYDGRTYYLSNSAARWSVANTAATNAGGHLAVVRNAAMNTWLRDAVTVVAPTAGFWIGLNDAGAEGTFRWINSAATGYLPWDVGEPNSAGGNEDYVEVKVNGSWNDEKNTTSRRYVVEVEATCLAPQLISGQPSGSAFPVGTTAVQYMSTDAAGNSNTCAFNITVTDNSDPTITCPAAMNVNANSGCTATGVALGSPVTADNCGVASVTNNAPASFPIGVTTVTWTVTDNAGRTATCAQTVTVTDNVDPTIVCPAAVNVFTNSGCTATGVALGTPVTADNCGVASVTNNAPASFPIGVTTVTWTVTDNAGRTATCAQTVTVTDNVDPTIVCPAAVNVFTNSGCTATGVALGTPVTADNCGVTSVTNNAPASFPIGVTTVIWTVTDNSGRTATCARR
ncbi:MAG: HYR domain-containing protein [Flavobacteriales bacterium]|nr:HYR domain-containing protein [Flavobacteriales bacterium]